MLNDTTEDGPSTAGDVDVLRIITGPAYLADRLDALAVEQQWEADYKAAVEQSKAAEAAAVQQQTGTAWSLMMPLMPLMPRCRDASMQGHTSDAWSTTEMSCADDLHFGDSYFEVMD